MHLENKWWWYGHLLSNAGLVLECGEKGPPPLSGMAPVENSKETGELFYNCFPKSQSLTQGASLDYGQNIFSSGCFLTNKKVFVVRNCILHSKDALFQDSASSIYSRRIHHKILRIGQRAFDKGGGTISMILQPGHFPLWFGM